MQNKGYLTARQTSASDNYYTPAYAVAPIVPLLQRLETIWCPFDADKSEYVKQLRAAGHTVIATSIADGHDFFKYEPKNYDAIVSNPPFSLKDDILKRVDSLGKPWALLLPLPTLQSASRFEILKSCEALIFDRRINFYKDINQTEIVKGVAFASIYICHNVLPERLMFKKLDI